MNLFKKSVTFALVILIQTTIQSASLFKTLQEEARRIKSYDQSEFVNASYEDITEEDLFVIIDPTCNCAKLAFFEQKPSGKYQVSFFTLQNPTISAEFTKKEDAQDFLYDFTVKPGAVIQKPAYFPLPPRGSGQDWRRIPSKPRYGRR